MALVVSFSIFKSDLRCYRHFYNLLKCAFLYGCYFIHGYRYNFNFVNLFLQIYIYIQVNTIELVPRATKLARATFLINKYPFFENYDIQVTKGKGCKIDSKIKRLC